MKFAVASESNQVSPHFGRCPEYTLVTVANGEITRRDTIQNPGLPHGHLPDFFSNLEIGFIITGGMGINAREKFNHNNIEPILGVSGNIDSVIQKFVEGTLERGESLCNHDGSHHHRQQCDHHKS